MSLEDIELSNLGPVHQANVPITDGSVVTLVDYEVGQRIWVMRFEISSNVASKFSIRSGNNKIFDMHAGQKWGHVNPSETRAPRYVTNAGEPLTIQSSQSSVDANVYIQWQMRGPEA
jgi:hypothetical protein